MTMEYYGDEAEALAWIAEAEPTQTYDRATVDAALAAVQLVPAIMESLPALIDALAEALPAETVTLLGGAEADLWESVEATPAEPDTEAENPGFIAAAGLLISATQLGLAVFDRMESHLLRGAFTVDAKAANFIHRPSPQGLTVQSRTFTFPLYAHHPRIGIGTQTFWFTVALDYDGFNIRRVSIIEDLGRSSSLISSDFTVTFNPIAYTATNEPVAAIAYDITGVWNPVGVGEESFSGRFIVDAAGELRSLLVSSSQLWVRSGAVSRSGGGPVPRPTLARHLTDVHFDTVGSARLTQENIRHIHRWWEGLPSAVQSDVRGGNLPISIAGRASTTGTVQANQTLARLRAAAVAAVLRDLAGTNARLVTSSQGELGARTADAQENPPERRVEISCEYQVYQL